MARFSWVATFATKTGAVGRRSGDLTARDMDDARAKVLRKLGDRAKLDLRISAND